MDGHNPAAASRWLISVFVRVALYVCIYIYISHLMQDFVHPQYVLQVLKTLDPCNWVPVKGTMTHRSREGWYDGCPIYHIASQPNHGGWR